MVLLLCSNIIIIAVIATNVCDFNRYGDIVRVLKCHKIYFHEIFRLFEYLIKSYVKNSCFHIYSYILKASCTVYG